MEIVTPDRTLDESTLPTEAELNQIVPGGYCRLQSRTGARFTVRVTDIQPDSLRGLTIDTIEGIGMKPAQLVVFNRQHVFGVV